MKAERLHRLLDGAVWDEALMAQLPRDVFELILRYILATDIDKTAFETKIQLIQHAQVRSNAMTLAQQYHSEGRKEGQREGRQEGRQEGALQSRRQDVIEILEIRFGAVPAGLSEEIAALADESKLRLLHRTAVQCSSIAVFADSL